MYFEMYFTFVFLNYERIIRNGINLLFSTIKLNFYYNLDKYALNIFYCYNFKKIDQFNNLSC